MSSSSGGLRVGARKRAAGSESPLRVLFVTPEVAPWAKSGGLGDVSAALPAALRAMGVDVRMLVPAYPSLSAAFRDAVPGSAMVHFGGTYAPARLLVAEEGVTVPFFLVECPPYYERGGDAYLDASRRDWADNHLRFGLLSRFAALLGSDNSPLAWRPHVVHGHDWPAGLTPAYMQQMGARRSAMLMTLHNVAFQGIFPATTLHALGLPQQSFSIDGVEYYGKLSFLKAAIQFADRISTVSPTYAREIQTEELGCGLGGLLRRRAADLTGILNGIDTALWDPAADPHLPVCYDFSRIEAKAENKVALQRGMGLRVEQDTPVLGVVSRLTEQKGMDILAALAPKLLNSNVQLALLGSGDNRIERQFTALAQQFPGRSAAVFGFDEAQAHLIEAGADVFLMPSRFEPCGLNQMYSMRYGTPPIVCATGGLADTVVDCTAPSLADGTATGFVFGPLNTDTLHHAIERALAAWRDKTLWRALQKNGMQRDFSWKKSAGEYRALYQALVRRN